MDEIRATSWWIAQATEGSPSSKRRLAVDDEERHLIRINQFHGIRQMLLVSYLIS